MPRPGAVFLMYHELELPGREPSCRDRGYLRYVIPERDFRAQLARLQALGLRGINVSESLGGAPGVVVTFDDGCETDLIAAAPALRDMGFQATFYIVAGFVGQRGCLTAAQVRELSDRSFEIGCHSMTHAYLGRLDQEQLRREIIEAKDRLEQLTGQPVAHFSCPGGRWSPAAARMASVAGYRSMSTSRVGINFEQGDPFRLARIAIKVGLTTDAFDALCQGKGLRRLRVHDAALSFAKKLMGDSTYEKIRGNLLGRS